MILKFFLLILSLNFVSSTSLECSFSERNEHGYKCDVETLRITSKDSRVITKVLGTHNSRRGNENVKFFDAIGKTIQFFPRELENFFPNLEIVQIYGGDLKEISHDDLKNFPNLKILRLSTNFIEFIDRKLFENNKNLEWIDLSYNKIKHVDVRAFEGLKMLKTLGFDSNLCHSGNAVNDPSAVGELVNQIEMKCIEVGYVQRERRLFKDQITDLQISIDDLQLNLTSTKSSLDRLDNENQGLKKENQLQSQEIRDLNLKLVKQISAKNSLDEEVEASKAEISQLKAQIDKIINEHDCGFLNEIIGDLKEAREERKSILQAVKSESSDYQIRSEILRTLNEMKVESDEILSLLTMASSERFEVKQELTQTCSSLSLQHFYKLQEISESLKGGIKVVGAVCSCRRQ